MPFAIAHDGARLFYEATSLVPPWRRAAGVIFMHHGVALDGLYRSDPASMFNAYSCTD